MREVWGYAHAPIELLGSRKVEQSDHGWVKEVDELRIFLATGILSNNVKPLKNILNIVFLTNYDILRNFSSIMKCDIMTPNILSV